MSSLASLATAEGVRLGPSPTRIEPIRWFRWIAIVAIGWSVYGTGVGRHRVVNAKGWPLASKFFRAAAHPDLSTTFLRRTSNAAATTIGYATLGTLVSLVLGSIGGILLARTTWSRRTAAEPDPVALRLARLAAAGPRGIHEAVWALLLINILGRNPLVGVLAIGIPYGAMTAKVFAELIDATAAEPRRVLRAQGAGRITSLAYGTLPRTSSDLVSYAFYRFECAVRSAVILGMIGAGGLGFQLSQSFQGLAYNEMWTSIYALVLIGFIAETWSASARAKTRRRMSYAIGAMLVLASCWKVRPQVGAMFSGRTRHEAGRLVTELWPPALPRDGWTEVAEATIATVRMSLVALCIAIVLAVPAALLGRYRLVRFAALVTRSIPSTVWAFIVLLVVLPGILPGAIALGIYTAGVLTRLLGEALTNADPTANRRLRAAGAGPISGFLYGTMPSVAPTWAAYSLYRWEVAAREVVVVGIVGAGGLGALLQQQTAAFAYHRLATTLIALVVVTGLVDMASAATRQAIR